MKYPSDEWVYKGFKHKNLSQEIKPQIKRARFKVSSYKLRKLTDKEKKVLKSGEDNVTEKLFKQLVSEDIIEIRAIALKEFDRLLKTVNKHPYCWAGCPFADACPNIK